MLRLRLSLGKIFLSNFLCLTFLLRGAVEDGLAMRDYTLADVSLSGLNSLLLRMRAEIKNGFLANVTHVKTMIVHKLELAGYQFFLIVQLFQVCQ